MKKCLSFLMQAKTTSTGQLSKAIGKYQQLPAIKSKSINTPMMNRPTLKSSLVMKNVSYFSENKMTNMPQKLTAENVPAEYTQIKPSEAIVGNEEIKVFKTKNSISILDKVPGVKDPKNGELYVLMFTCTKCNTKSIRSFTKHSYHQGVVLVRCGGCESVHLVADNLKWFQDNPVNIQTMHQGKVQKVHDQVAIVNFLNKAFSEDKEESKQKQQKQSNEK